jgi:peptidoglycan/xylan/chitin deacetylase (PgdA/CDA1 family)
MISEVVAPFNPKDYTGQAVVAITYDDGLCSHFVHAVPLHLQYSIPATFAIIGGQVASPGSWERYMKPQQIIQLPRHGFEIASHGLGHKTKFREMDDATLDAELGDSKKLLQGYIANGSIDSICIPFSSYDERVANHVEKYFKVARVVGNRYADLSKGAHPIRSFLLDANTTFADVKQIIDDAVKEKEAIVFTMHGVSEGVPENKAEIPVALLEALLKYCNKMGLKKLLPIRLRDIAALREMRNVSTKTSTEISEKARAKNSASKVLDNTIENTKVTQRYFAPQSEIKKFLLAPRGETVASLRLAEDEDFLVTFHKNQQENDTILISFGGLPSKKTETGFGSEFALSNGLDHIFVAQREKTQYQGLSLEDFKKAVTPVIGGKKVFTYGSSLGAYCSVYYGGCINARIISAAPKNSAHPSMLKKGFENIKFTHRNYAANPLSAKAPVIIYDPHREEETTFIQKLIRPAYPNAEYVELPFAGHTVLQTMLESDVLKDFIFGLLKEDRVIKVNLKKEDSFIWHCERGRQFFNNQDYPRAIISLKKSIDLKPNTDAIEYLLLIYAALEKSEEALNLLLDGKDWHPEVDFIRRMRIATRDFRGFIANLEKRLASKAIQA